LAIISTFFILDGENATDYTGFMGNPYKDDVSAMCYNAPKTWRLGWYDSNKETIDPTKGQWSGTIVGVADFEKKSQLS
jgi:hypothetical protein